jgi:membrane protein DedA with SNARE-associated domain
VAFFDQLGALISGLPTWAAYLAIICATFVTEDLTCIAAGLIAAGGDLPAFNAIAAAALGIWIGDLLLYWAGHAIGRPALRRPPVSWFVHDEDVEQSEQWFAHRGAMVILLGRAVPGSRLPTYFTAGLLNLGFGRFALLAFIAVLVWAPLLGGSALLLGRQVLAWVELYETWALPALIGTVLALFLVIKFLIPMFTWRGRRLVVSRLRRMRNWEFWPPWLFYAPVVFYFLWLALRHRSLSLFTAVNPSFPAGGFIGESKSQILEQLSPSGECLVRSRRVPRELAGEAKAGVAREFMADHGLGFPVVLKPDAGQRGSGVAIVRDDEGLVQWFEKVRVDAVVQEYAIGQEFGIFYYRYPDEEQGRIFSITRKVFPEVEGDGEHTLEHLILADQRAVCLARTYFEKNVHHLWDVPARGERVKLVDVGNHCQGAMFFDGTALRTEAMEQAIDKLSKSFPGFYFGRYDVRTTSVEDFQRGENFKVIELNGATSEATHIYDPAFTLLGAYRTLFEQWRILFRIAAQNRARGAPVVHWTELLRELGHYRRMARSHP